MNPQSGSDLRMIAGLLGRTSSGTLPLANRMLGGCSPESRLTHDVSPDPNLAAHWRHDTM